MMCASGEDGAMSFTAFRKTVRHLYEGATPQGVRFRYALLELNSCLLCSGAPGLDSIAHLPTLEVDSILRCIYAILDLFTR